MYCGDLEREELEDELYREEEDSEGSEVNSELEFQLYSQLHYSSNPCESDIGKESEGEGDNAPHLEAADELGAENGAWRDELQKQSSDEGELWQQLTTHAQPKRKKTKERLEKRKKAKDDRKGHRSLPLEEIIVIDSGTDAVTVSDGDTDSGVCAQKGKKSKRHVQQASTPVQQTSQKKRKASSPDPVVVLDSDDCGFEVEELDSHSGSDSDSLENWMILGRANQDGDQSISLNLEFQPDSNTEDDGEAEGSWLVSHKDKQAQIYNRDKGSKLTVRRLPTRYYSEKNVTCRNCSNTGHLSKNCPKPKKVICCYLCGVPGHQAIGCPNKHCNNCGLPGHLYESCSERAYWHKRCHRCGMTGHFFDACPEIWRQYHFTTKPGPVRGQKQEDPGRSPSYCYNCSRMGHFGHDCNQRRMFNGTFASTPFINHYDTEDDIRRRNHRTLKRVKELKDAGLFPSISQGALTPGPPRKKQKTNHHSNSQRHHTPVHHSNHKPHHTPGNHIRFSGGLSLPASTPKTKMVNQRGSQQSSAKQWKPKREVPLTRPALPPVKSVIDEAADFPRGGGLEEKKRKRQRKKKKKNEPPGPPGAPFQGHQSIAHTRDRLFGTESVRERKKRKYQGMNQRVAAKRAMTNMHLADENLFIIKQRKNKK